MRVHLVQTGTVAIKQIQRERREAGIPILNILLDKRWTEPLPIFAFVIEHPEGLIVVDTGETARAIEPGYFPRWHPYYKYAVREWVQPMEEIGPQMRAMGLEPNDVSRVLLTHLHTDHAGGLTHFPRAEHLVARSEYMYARGIKGRVRGYPSNRWPRWFKPSLIEMQPEQHVSFPTSFRITRAGDVRFVPTPGHTPGHLSVVITTPDVNYFLAGDASYTQGLMLSGKIDGVSRDLATARQTLERVHAYCGKVPTVYLPSHDPDTPDRLANREIVVTQSMSDASMMRGGAKLSGTAD